VFAETAGAVSWGTDLALLLTVPALIAVNGFFVAAEFALVAVRRTRVEEMVSQGVAGARPLEKAVTHLDRAIAATQLGITLASIGLGYVAEPALARLVHPLFTFLPGNWSAVATHSMGTTLAFLLITFLHVVFGELIPKTVAIQIPDRTALWVVRPLQLFTWVSRPLIVLMNGTGNLILRLFGFETNKREGMFHSVEELLLLIEDSEEAGLVDPEQAEYVENVFELSTKQVRECMVPRERMMALELSTEPEKVLEIVRAGAHTRLPVYEGELDRIVGIVNTKDLFYLFSLKGVVVLQDALYPPLFLPPDESIGSALRLFRKARRPMALVRSDEGHILGLITLEDVIEEIIGDIEDEHDRPIPRRNLRLRRARAAQAQRAGGSGARPALPLRSAPPAPGAATGDRGPQRTP
jgi:putative hemolysin